jgi:hypothetical protein
VPNDPSAACGRSYCAIYERYRETPIPMKGSFQQISNMGQQAFTTKSLGMSGIYCGARSETISPTLLNGRRELPYLIR